MKHDELADLHANIDRLKRHLAAQPDIPDDVFTDYDTLGVTPDGDYAKGTYQYAILQFGICMASQMSDDEFDTGGELQRRLTEHACTRKTEAEDPTDRTIIDPEVLSSID